MRKRKKIYEYLHYAKEELNILVINTGHVVTDLLQRSVGINNEASI